MAEETKSNKQSQEEEFKRNRPELDGVPDLSQLVYLDMPNVVHNLKHRYCKMKTKQCYTSISSILLAINPYETLPIYGSDVINEFHSSALKGRLVQGRPHPYGVSARAYMRMVQRKCNQSVIVCGESGAGKTETTKLLMRYLAMTAPVSVISSKDTTSSVEEQIVAASPILEAYGNAKTVMNNNSSRFGKFTKLLYNVPANTQQGNILGSSLETYLLEKSRVVYQALNERNYHIFYFLHAGLGKNNAEYGLETIDKFNYTNQGKCFMPMKDIERYEELTEMLTKFRIEQNVQNILWKLTAGVLNIGNINFIRTGDGFTEIDKKSMKYLNVVSKLWGLKATELEKRLTTKSLKVGNNNITQKVQFDSAVSNRDSIAKGIYENIFLWLCKRINAELLVEDEEEDEVKVDDKYFIGILDVFGFENFYFNSLEQFCINYTNEKLQQFFNFHIIASEQEEYIREGVFWKPLTIPDNKDYIQLVENQKIGFFSLLDSSCTGPSKNDTIAFMQLLFRKQGKNPVIKQVNKPGSGNWRGEKPQNARPRRRGGGQKFDGFVINHFADDVTYDVSKFLIKNMESVHSDTNKMIKKSKESIFKEINGVDGASKKRRRRTRKSVTSVFHSGIKRLMKSLNQTEPYFVRCINPNKQKSSKVWNEEIVEHQLRCGGLIEALRVLKLGYPTRVPYKLLYEKYHSHVSNPLIKNMSAEAFSTSLLIAFDVNENDYELGLTKIFFKPAKAAILDTIMSKAGQPLTKAQNDKITKFIVDKRCKQIIGVVKAFTNIRKMIRMKRASKQWESKGRIAALLGGTVMKHLKMARKIIKQRKQKSASVLMQTFFRAMYERKHFIKYIDKVKKSSKIIWLAYNNMKQRHGIVQTLDKLIAKRIEKQNAMPKPKPKPKPEPVVVREPEPVKPIVNTVEISKEEQLRIAREKQREEDANLRKAIELEKVKQEQRGSIEIDERKESGKKDSIQAKIEKERIIQENKEKRREQDKEKRRQQRKAKRDRLRRKKYKQNPGDTTDYDTSDTDNDDYYQTDSDTDTDDEQVEDIKTALAKFHKIAAMGQLFFRHAGSRSRNKPQDRVVKVSFDHDHKPMEISWGSGSRRIYFKDILYISYGHYTPVFNLRKDVLHEQKCFSVIAQSNGVTQCLDLEGYNEYIAELWVKGLRKLKGHTQEYSDKMARKNMKNLIHNSGDSKRRRANDKKKITDIMKLQQDLFIMSTHTVLRHLEEERIWNIDDALKEKFEPKKMYPIALKQDIPWRQWQHWLREQITTYLRENNGVIPKYNNNNNFNASGTMIFNTEQIKQIHQPISPYIDNRYNSVRKIPSNNNVYGGVNTYVNDLNKRAEYPKKKRESIGGIEEEEKCSLM